jgi:hypothetical protein
MARRRLDRGTRTIVATAGVVVGLAVGIVVVAIVNAGGDGGGGEPAPYQPFFVGTSDRIEKRIKADGPECYQDPREGLGSFCLDLDGNEFIALHVVPPGGTTECLVQWDRKERRYEDCRGAAVDRTTLARFPVLTREINEKISVFVDVRTPTPPSTAAASQ